MLQCVVLARHLDSQNEGCNPDCEIEDRVREASQ